jgi:DNA (cytosine-5)-methyltransferase 1
MKLKIVDLFCGAGGFTTGVEAAIVNGEKIADVVACINHDPLAIISHEKNHPECKHYTEDITEFNEQLLPSKNMFPDDLLILHASLECTNFSKAKGGKPRDADSRTLANHLIRYIEWLNPDYITIENVREFMAWGPLDAKGKPVSRLNGIDYMRWKQSIEDLGYRHTHRMLNSANYGAHTSRERYFGIFAKGDLPIAFPEATHDKHARNGLEKWKPVKEKLDFDNEGKSIFGRDKSLSEKTLERIYAGLIKYVAKGDTSFISKYYSGNDALRNTSVETPCGVIRTNNCAALIQVKTAFISKYFSGRPETKNIPVEGPAGTIKTKDGQALVQAEFLTSYYSSGENLVSVDDALPTISTKDRFAIYFIQKCYSGGGDLQDIDSPSGTIMSVDKHRLIESEFFIDKQYSGNKNHQSVESPTGSILSNDKHSLIEAQKFIMDTQFNNVGGDIEKPLGTVTANRKYHYIINPQYNNKGASIDEPAPVIIARQDKKPMGMITTEHGDAAVIIVYDDDSEAMKKIKIFMAEFGLIDIKMRMLTVMELKTITGFPDDYYLAGAQASQKKFIGNAVTPVIPKKWMEALWSELVHYLKVAA